MKALFVVTYNGFQRSQYFLNGATLLTLPRFRKDMLRVKQVGERGIEFDAY